MSRPKHCRRICEFPQFWSFKPDCQNSDTVYLTLDEYEAIRLIDFKRLTQQDCAALMQVSRATVAGIYDSARYKISDFLINGKQIRIVGGSYTLDSISQNIDMDIKGDKIMRIAITYENGDVGQHFGKTEKFKIYDVDNKKIVSSQIVDTNGAGHGALAGFLCASQVDVVICGGIGQGAREALLQTQIQLLPGVKGDVDEVIKAYLENNLDFDPNITCNHNHSEHENCHSSHNGNNCDGKCHN